MGAGSKKQDPPAGVDLVLAESVRFELTVGHPITSFQDWLLKPLGHLSMWGNYTILPSKSQACEKHSGQQQLTGVFLWTVGLSWSHAA